MNLLPIFYLKIAYVVFKCLKVYLIRNSWCILRIADINTSCKQIRFGAGNFSLYSDFDGTYMPFEHREICCHDAYKNNPEVKNLFNHCFFPFQNFLNKFGDKFNFIITTGRNRPEFNYFIDKLKEQGADIPKPDSLITCDGKDIFYKQGGTYPKTSIDNHKRNELNKKLTWKPSSILPQIQSIVSKTQTSNKKPINVIESPINKNSTDYGDISLQYLLECNDGLKDSFASFNEGYDYSPYIVFSDNANVEYTKKQLEIFLKSNNINANVSYCKEDWDVEYGKSYQSLSIKPYPTEGFWKNKKINKLIDTHKKVEDIYRNKTNDLVIVAGDAGNDEDMLNIFNYVDILGLEIPARDQYSEFLQNKQNRELLRQLPIISIVVGTKHDLDLIRKNQDLLDQYNIGKTIYVDYGRGDTLIDGVKKAVSMYSNDNEEFKNSLGAELLNEISQANTLLNSRYDKLMEKIKNLFNKIEEIKESLYA